MFLNVFFVDKGREREIANPTTQVLCHDVARIASSIEAATPTLAKQAAAWAGHTSSVAAPTAVKRSAVHPPSHADAAPSDTQNASAAAAAAAGAGSGAGGPVVLLEAPRSGSRSGSAPSKVSPFRMEGGWRAPGSTLGFRPEGAAAVRRSSGAGDTEASREGTPAGILARAGTSETLLFATQPAAPANTPLVRAPASQAGDNGWNE